MNKRIQLIIAVLLAGCGGGDEASPMPGMTADEHARMQAGATQGAVDSAGMVVRQTVQLTADQERALGVVYLTVERDSLVRTVRTVGAIQPAEPNVVEITPKIDGYVEELFVNSTGQAVRELQPLLTLYSPALIAAQEELLTARRLVDRLDSTAGEAWESALQLLVSTRRRLRYWDITEEQIAEIEESGVVTRALTLMSPVTGVVLDKGVVQGQHVRPGMPLYRLADLSEVWVEGEVFEQDLQFVRIGTQSHIEVAAYPGQHRMGRVSFVYPTVDPDTRTNRIRVTVANRNGALKPGMFATIYFDARIRTGVVVIPLAAVVVTGERNVVFVRDAAGTLVPRDVVLGARADHRVQVLGGLNEGEVIVASANFLVDAESRLAGGGGMPGMQHAEPGDTTPVGEGHIHD